MLITDWVFIINFIVDASNLRVNKPIRSSEAVRLVSGTGLITTRNVCIEITEWMSGRYFQVLR